ncbi:guanylate kinase, partial [Slackia isoflavoniconvertens]
VVLEIDVQGAFQVREKMPAARLVFIEPPSLRVLEERLRGRGTEGDEVIEARMKAAEVELSHKMEYDMRLVNDNLDEATDALVRYVNEQAEKARG